MSNSTQDQYERERQFFRELLIACEKDELEKVQKIERELQQKGISVCDYRDGKKAGVVHAAARGGAKRTLEYLLKIKPEQGGLKDSEGRTPLMSACSADNASECVKFLLTENTAAKATVNEDSNGIRAVHMAASLNNGDSLKFILEFGKVDPDSPSSAGTPLHWAAGHSSTIETCKILLETKKVDVNARDPQGSTPIIIASLRGKPEIVQLLCESGSDLNVFAYNLSALGAAAVSGSKSCCEILLKYGGDQLCLSRDPIEHLLPVEVAAHAGNDEIVNFLAKKSGLGTIDATKYIKDIQTAHQEKVQKENEVISLADAEATRYKEEGNALYASKSYEEAIARYQLALNDKSSNKIKAQIYCNMSACYFKLNKFEEAKKYAEKAKVEDPKFLKSYYRLGQVYSELKDHENAAKQYWDAYNVGKSTTEGPQYLQLFNKEIEMGKKAYAKQQSN